MPPPQPHPSTGKHPHTTMLHTVDFSMELGPKVGVVTRQHTNRPRDTPMQPHTQHHTHTKGYVHTLLVTDRLRRVVKRSHAQDYVPQQPQPHHTNRLVGVVISPHPHTGICPHTHRTMPKQPHQQENTPTRTGLRPDYIVCKLLQCSQYRKIKAAYFQSLKSKLLLSSFIHIG